MLFDISCFSASCYIFSIVRRLCTLISQQAQLQAQAEASQKQAQSASDACKKLMEEKENLSNMVKKMFLMICKVGTSKNK